MRHQFKRFLDFFSGPDKTIISGGLGRSKKNKSNPTKMCPQRFSAKLEKIKLGYLRELNFTFTSHI